LRLPKTYAFTAAVILNENNAGSFQRLAKRCLIRERNWDLQPLLLSGSSLPRLLKRWLRAVAMAHSFDGDGGRLGGRHGESSLL
jgi:hypothetical protein